MSECSVKKNEALFKEKLEKANQDKCYHSKNVDEALNTFYEIYNKAFAELFSVKKLSRNRAKDKHWMTTGLRKIIVNKNRLYKKSLLKPTSENIKEYKQYRNITTTCLRKAEENYFLSIIDKEKQNLSTLWNLVGDIINPNKIKRQTRIDKLIMDDKIIRDNNGIAETLNSFFSTIGNQLAHIQANTILQTTWKTESHLPCT